MVLLDRLRRAVKKLTFLLNLKNYLALTRSTLRLASMIAPGSITGGPRWGRRAISFNDRPGLRACVTDRADHLVGDHSGNEETNNNTNNSSSPIIGIGGSLSGSSSVGNSPRTLQRTTSYPLEEDVDRQAEMFIDNFYRHLIFEKQVSLNLRYCRRDSSFDYSSTDSSLVSPLSSTTTSLVSPT